MSPSDLLDEQTDDEREDRRLKELESLRDSFFAGELLFVYDSVFMSLFVFGAYVAYRTAPALLNSDVTAPASIASCVAIALWMIVLRRLQDAIMFTFKLWVSGKLQSGGCNQLRLFTYELFNIGKRSLPDVFRPAFVAFCWCFIQSSILSSGNYSAPWFKTVYTWPQKVQTVTCDIVSISDTLLEQFFKWTNNDVVIGALTDLWGLFFTVEKWRVRIRELFSGSTWQAFQEGCNGIVHVYTFRSDPLGQTAVLAIAVAAALCCLCFYRSVRALLNQVYFWLFILIAGIVAAFAMYIAYDLALVFIYLVVPGSAFTRTYTALGVTALKSGIGVLGSAFVCMCLPNQENDEDRVDVYRMRQQHLASKLKHNHGSLTTDVKVGVEKAMSTVEHFGKAASALLLSETAIFVGVTAVVLAYTVQAQLPIEDVHFSSLNITRYPDFMSPEYNSFESYWEHYQFTTLQQLEIDIADNLINTNLKMLEQLESYLPSLPGFTIPNACLDSFLGPIIGAFKTAIDDAIAGYNAVVGGYNDVVSYSTNAFAWTEGAFASQAAFTAHLQQAIGVAADDFNYIAGFACSQTSAITSQVSSSVASSFNAVCGRYFTTQSFMKAAAILSKMTIDDYNKIAALGSGFGAGAVSTWSSGLSAASGYVSGATDTVSSGLHKLPYNYTERMHEQHKFNTMKYVQMRVELDERVARFDSLRQMHYDRFQLSHRGVQKYIQHFNTETQQQQSGTHNHTTKNGRFRTKSSSSSSCIYSIATVLNEIDIPFPQNGIHVPGLSLSGLLQEVTSDLAGLLRSLVALIIPVLNDALDSALSELNVGLQELEKLLQPVIKLATAVAVDLYEVFKGLRLDIAWIPSWIYNVPLFFVALMVLLCLCAVVQPKLAHALMVQTIMYLIGIPLGLVFAVLSARVVLESFGYTFTIVWRADWWVFVLAFVMTPLSCCLLLIYDSEVDTVDPEIIKLVNKLQSWSRERTVGQSEHESTPATTTNKSHPALHGIDGIVKRMQNALAKKEKVKAKYVI